MPAPMTEPFAKTGRPARTGGLAGNLLALGLSDVAQRVSRLAVVVVVARYLDAGAIGLAAGVIAASDILKALAENGVVQRVIASPESDLEAACITGHRIQSFWCLGLFVLQLAVGAALWWIDGSALTFAMTALLGAEYLLMPPGLMSCALAMREGKLKQTAAIGGAQVVFANLLTAGLAFAISGPLALVLPRVLSAPIWLIGMRRLRPWHPAPGLRGLPLSHFTGYGAAVLGVEVVKALRLQADKLVVGVMLGPEMLGFYFLAFNAGLGLATSFANAFGTALFPWLCAAPDRKAALRKALIVSLVVLAPIVAAQALIAPWYVPVLFGAHWDGISEIVSILCLAAIPSLVWTAAAQSLRAEGRPAVEFRVTLALAAALVANTALTAPFGLKTTAIGYLAVATVIQLIASWPAIATALLPPKPAPALAT